MFSCPWVIVDVHFQGAFLWLCIVSKCQGRKLSDHLFKLRIMGNKSLLCSPGHQALYFSHYAATLDFKTLFLHRRLFHYECFPSLTVLFALPRPVYLFNTGMWPVSSGLRCAAFVTTSDLLFVQFCPLSPFYSFLLTNCCHSDQGSRQEYKAKVRRRAFKNKLITPLFHCFILLIWTCFFITMFDFVSYLVPLLPPGSFLSKTRRRCSSMK